MQILVSGKSFSVGAALTQHVEAEIDYKTTKYFEKPIEAEIVFAKEGSHGVRCDIIINEGTGKNVVIRGNAVDNDAYIAFDSAIEKIEKQLRRYKRKLKNHHKVSHIQRDQELSNIATKYTIQNEEEAGDNPLIIAEKQTDIENLTVSDAVMKMNLANLPALMFVNKKTNKLSVVYNREDGNVSWIDTQADVSEYKQAV